MSTADSVKTELAGLLTKANAATGNADTTLHDAVYALVEGYGQGGGGDIDALIDGSITEITSNVETMRDYAFRGSGNLIDANFPNLKAISAHAFYGCGRLKSLNAPAVETIRDYGLYSTPSLTGVNFPLVTQIGGNGMQNCGMVTAKFPRLSKINGSAFYGCSKLESIEFDALGSIVANTFYQCSVLTAVILRSETAATLSSTNAFTRTPIASGTGYIYVPAALVDTYKAATNWSTYAAQFRALEDYTVDGTITGELDPNKI